MGRDFLGRCLGAEAGDGVAITINQEFCEIPGDVFCALLCANVQRLSRLQIPVQATSPVAVDLCFCKHRKCDIVSGSGELLDLGIAAWFLRAKLIAGERQYGETTVFVVFVQSTQPGVLWCEASGARDIYDQAHLIFEICEVDGFAVYRVHREIVHIAHCWSS